MWRRLACLRVQNRKAQTTPRMVQKDGQQVMSDRNDDNPDGEKSFEDQPIEIEIDGVLDLHTFQPREVSELLDDYLQACVDKGILDVRIIHGKGKGILRDRVRSILKRHALVDAFSEAPLEAGSWGATLVRLKPGSWRE
ncbi:MAG: Smr/MutS family protein [Thermodesulfobacteriota bacterium]